MYEISHTDIRLIYATVLILVIDPLKVSILGNLLHRKQMIQLRTTLVVWIIFVINNAEDGSYRLTIELLYSEANFPERAREPKFVRGFLDVFYGFSIVRRKSIVINFCYFVFDCILYPNSLFFTIMVSLFFLLIVGILLVTLLNFLGWTNIDLDVYAGQQLNNRHGLNQKEIQKLEECSYVVPEANQNQ